MTESQGNAHPHLHALLIVKTDLDPSILAQWWRSLVGHACLADALTIPDRHEAVRWSHYIARGVEKTTRTPSPAFVDALVEAVYKRRLISASGVIAEAIRANAGASTKMKVNKTKSRTAPRLPAPSVALHHWLTSTQQYKRVPTATHQASATQGLVMAQRGALTAPPTTPPRPTSTPPKPPIKPSGLWASCQSIAHNKNTASLALSHSAGGQP